jgi:LDH2 family malate/lactate/ureidoglycolate dehydrogenase
MPLIRQEALHEYAKKIFEAVGTPPEHAGRVARMLVDADLAGYPSHGVNRIKQYLNAIKTGKINPQAVPSIEVESQSYANVNGNRAFGQIAATFAAEVAIEKARRHGMAMVGCYNMGHAGRLGDYTDMAAAKDLIGVAFCNGGGPNVAPYGSRERVLGTNPLACSVPAGPGRSARIDFASGASAEGKLNVARNKGERIMEGLIQDREGRPTTDPNDFYNGGSILPIGWQKGSALGVMMEILGGIFTGGRCSAFEGYIDGNGIVILVMKPDLFRNRADFDRDIGLLHSAVTGSRKAEGFRRIYFPGEPEIECREKSLREGIALDDTTWETIRSLGDALNVPAPTGMGRLSG